MLIAIEGVDGAGKTTLIEQLRKNSQRYFLIVRSAGYPKSIATRSRYAASIGALKELMTPEHVVLDRCIAISESIYGPICRNTPKWTDDEILNELYSVDVVVYCRPPDEVIHRNSRVNEQMAGVLERIDPLITAYDELIDWLGSQRSGPTVIYYDYTTDDVDSLAMTLRL